MLQRCTLTLMTRMNCNLVPSAVLDITAIARLLTIAIRTIPNHVNTDINGLLFLAVLLFLYPQTGHTVVPSVISLPHFLQNIINPLFLFHLNSYNLSLFDFVCIRIKKIKAELQFINIISTLNARIFN